MLFVIFLCVTVYGYILTKDAPTYFEGSAPRMSDSDYFWVPLVGQLGMVISAFLFWMDVQNFVEAKTPSSEELSENQRKVIALASKT